MKRYILALALLSLSCSTDDEEDCQAKKDFIHEEYQRLLGNEDISDEQRAMLHDEYSRKLEEACQ